MGAGLRGPAIFHLLLAPAIVASLCAGPASGFSPREAWDWLIHPGDASLAGVGAVILNVRLPRALLACLVGAGLSVSGGALQALFRNPLVSPDVLGLSAGAAFGASLALSTAWVPVQPCAFLFGIAATGLSYFLAASRRGLSVVSLILAGIIVTGIFTALLTIVQILSDPFKLQTIVHWTMGNLHNATWSKVQSAALPVLAGSGLLFWMRWRLNVLALGDVEARAVGVNPEREKLLVLLAASLAASAAVAVAGIIGMVGLAVPHMVRLLVGPDNRRSIPVCASFGALFLLMVDNVSRVATTFEVPVGVFTTLIGGPFFFYLLKRARTGYAEE